MSREELERLEELLHKYVWSHATEPLAQDAKRVRAHTKRLKGRAD